MVLGTSEGLVLNALMIVRDFQRQKCGSFATSQSLKIEVITQEYVGTLFWKSKPH